eukprot:scaffold15004_cov130-Isochrysis_galbana.AAC.4
MAPRSARASAPAKTISKTSKAKPASKEHADAGKRHAKPEPAPTPRPKMNVPKRWLKDPDREWFIESGAKSDKRKKAPHYYTVRCWQHAARRALSHAHRVAPGAGGLPNQDLVVHVPRLLKSHRAPDAVHAYALSDETIAQLKEYQKDKAAERREKRSAKDGGAPAKQAESEPFLKEPPPPGLPEGCHERYERAVRSANKRMFEKMTVEEMKHQLRAQDQLITGTRRELVSGRDGTRPFISLFLLSLFSHSLEAARSAHAYTPLPPSPAWPTEVWDGSSVTASTRTTTTTGAATGPSASTAPRGSTSRPSTKASDDAATPAGSRRVGGGSRLPPPPSPPH